MTFEEFEVQIGRLIMVFGDKAYPNERKKMFWDKFRNVPKLVFQKTIDGCIADHQHPPMITKIEAEMKTHWRWYFEAFKKEVIEPEPCVPCESSGILFAFKKNENHAPYAFRCNWCLNASNERAAELIPRWSIHFEKEYDLVGPNKIISAPIECDVQKIVSSVVSQMQMPLPSVQTESENQ